MIGKTISHYKILEKLGEGGMGVVYKAEDTKLKRTVALKFLPPELTRNEDAKNRFVHESRTAAALNHPNICTIYEIDESEGQSFISMEYVEGQSIREKTETGPLKLEDALNIAIQTAEGLKEAHEKEIVHRDIKSTNIMVTEKGQAKIMDFGLAKLAGRTKLTKTGTTIGTVAYMSPEQTRGEKVDYRSDIWSLGVVLYEMITGQLPFKGDYEQAVVYSIVNEEPELITGLRTGVPMELERIVNKTLAKNPAERYQHVDELQVDLISIGRKTESDIGATVAALGRPRKLKRIYFFGGLAGVFLLVSVVLYFMVLKGFSRFEEKSIAVLPFVDMSPQKDQEYFCDGIAEEIINVLTRTDRLLVASRTSAFQFKGEGYDIQDIGSELNVQTVLEGSVRKEGKRLRITAKLINAADGYHLWSDTYDRDMEDIFAIQDTITLAIVDNLKLKLFGDERSRLMKRHTENKEAYDLYLKGRYFWNRRHVADLEKAIEYFQRAIETDSLYAPAYVGMADVYNILGLWSFQRPKDAFPKAKVAVEKALELDDMLGEAHVSLGFIHTFFDWDWQAAEMEFRRAIELSPSYPMAHQWYALYLVAMERFDEAIEEVERGIELDRLSPLANTIGGAVFYYASKPNQAIEQLRTAIELEPNFPFSHYWMGQTYFSNAMYDEAMVEFQKALSFPDKSNYALGGLGMLYTMAGRLDDALQILDRLTQLSREGYCSYIARAVIYIALGQKDRAFEHLDRAYLEREPPLIYLNLPSAYSSIREDPRFTELLKKMGFYR